MLFAGVVIAVMLWFLSTRCALERERERDRANAKGAFVQRFKLSTHNLLALAVNAASYWQCERAREKEEARDRLTAMCYSLLFVQV